MPSWGGCKLSCAHAVQKTPASPHDLNSRPDFANTGNIAISFCTFCQHRLRNKPGHYLSGAGGVVQSVSALLLSKPLQAELLLLFPCANQLDTSPQAFGSWGPSHSGGRICTMGLPSCYCAPFCSRLTLGARAMGDCKSVCNCTLQRRRKNRESLYVHRFQVCSKLCCGIVHSFAVDAIGMDSELSGKVLPSEIG